MRLQAVHALEYETGADVELDHASFAVLRQIRIKGLRLYLPSRPHEPDNLVLEADDVILEHQPWSILARRLRLNTVTVYGGRLYLWYDRTRRLSNLQLLPLRGSVTAGSQRPRIVLRNAGLQYRELRHGQLAHTVHQTLSGDIFPAPGNVDIINFQLNTTGAGLLPNTTLEGTYNVQNKTLKTAGSFLIDLIDFDHLPPQVGPWQQWCKLAQPAGHVNAYSTYEPQKGHTFQFELSQGRLAIPLPDTNLPLHDLNARITCTADSLIIEHLNARYKDYGAFQLNGEVHGYNADAPFQLTFQTHDLNIPPDQWNNLERPPETTTETLRPREPNGPPMSILLSLLPDAGREEALQMAPTGRLDLNLNLNRDAPGPDAPVDYLGRLTLHDASITHQDFPYPLQHVRGDVTFQPRHTVIGPLNCFNETRRIDIQGLWQQKNDHRHLDITVDTRNTPLDETLLTALPHWQQRLWRQFNPSGAVNAHYRLTRVDDVPTREELTLDLLDLDAAYRAFAVPLTNMVGKAHYDGQRLTFNIDKASPPTGQLSLTGAIEDLDQDTPRLRCDVQFQNLLLDEAFRDYLPQHSRDALAYVGLLARADGAIRLQVPDPQAPPLEAGLQRDALLDLDLARYQLTANLYQGHALCSAFPYPLDDLAANVQLTNEGLDIRSLSARHDDSRIDAKGRLNTDRSYQLHLEGKPLLLSPELRQAFGKQPLSFWDYFNPAGPAHVTLDIARQQSAPTTYAATVVPINCTFEPDALPYRFQNVNGTILIEPNALTVQDLTASNGAAQLQVKGQALFADPNAHRYHFNIKADDVPLDDQLQAALPASIRQLYRQLDPNGLAGAELQLTSNTYLDNTNNSDDAPPVWNIQGRAWTKNAHLLWPMPAQNINLQLQGNARYVPAHKTFDLTAQLDADSLHIMDRPLNNVTANVLYDSDERRLELNDVSSQFCQGRLAGQSRVFFDHYPPGYELKLQFHQVDLPSALQAHRPIEERYNLQGKLAGSFNLTQTAHTTDRRGAFLFTLEDAVLGELPVMGQLLHVLNLSLPRPGAFNEATLAGDVVGPTYRFDQIKLRGSAMTLTGGGLMTEPNHQLELVFEVESPHDLPRIPIISSFVKAMQPSIMQVRITGPFDEPTVESVAFPSLDNALRHLTGQLPAPTPHPPKGQSTHPNTP